MRIAGKRAAIVPCHCERCRHVACNPRPADRIPYNSEKIKRDGKESAGRAGRRLRPDIASGIGAVTRDPSTPQGRDRRSRRVDFRTDIEGLRAVAILAVVAFHAGLSAVPGGYVGVDVFFVISGFLITEHLGRELFESGQISFGAFYARRARRLLPSALLVIGVTVAVSCAVLPPLQAMAVAKDGLANAFYVGNYRYALQATNYLSVSGPVSPLLNYWSLGVEEQFYLVWPALLVGGLPGLVAPTHANAPAFAGKGAAAVRSASSWRWPSWRSAPSLSQSGSLGSTSRGPSSRSPREPGNWPSEAFWLSVRRDFAGCHPGGCPCSAGRASGPSSSRPSPSRRPHRFRARRPSSRFSAPPPWWPEAAPASRLGAVWLLGRWPMQVIGRVSYTWYLWHWPALVLAPAVVGHPLSVWGNVGVCALALVLAALTTVLLERPLQRAPWLARPRRSLLLTVVVERSRRRHHPALDRGPPLTHRERARPHRQAVGAASGK